MQLGEVILPVSFSLDKIHVREQSYVESLVLTFFKRCPPHADRTLCDFTKLQFLRKKVSQK